MRMGRVYLHVSALWALLAALPAQAQRTLYWIGQPTYQTRFTTSAELAEWNLIENYLNTGSWTLSGHSSSVLKMDNAVGGNAVRIMNVTTGTTPRLLALDKVNGVVEFQVIGTTGLGQRAFVQAQQYTSAGVYIATELTLINVSPAAAGSYRVALSGISWAPTATQVRFVIGGDNSLLTQGTVDLQYFAYYKNGQAWENPANWSLTSGGTGGAAIPTATDTVRFDAGSKSDTYLNSAAVAAKIVLGPTYPNKLIQQGQTLTVGAGGIFVQGGTLQGGTAAINTSSLTVTGGTFATPSANLTLTRNLIVGAAGNLNAAVGTLVFAGTAAQTFQSIPALSINNLTLNNAAGLTLSQDMAAAGTVSVLRGYLNTGTYTVALGLTGTLSETPAVGGYLWGKVSSVRNMGLLNLGQTFGGLGIAITEISLLSNPTTVLRQTGVPTPISAELTSLLRRFYITPTTNLNLSATATISYAEPDMAPGLAEERLKVYGKGTTGGWQLFTPIADTVNNTLTVLSLTSFAMLTAASLTAPLPVVLSGLEAEAQPRATVVQWATASEINSAWFEVERSADGRTYATLGRVEAAGHSAKPLAYRFVDADPGTGAAYYRLRQLDRDGAAQLSPAVLVQRKAAASTPALRLYPNPSDGHTLYVEGMDEGAPLSVYSLAGRLLFTQPAPAAGTPLRLTQALPPGGYVLRAAGGGSRRFWVR